MVQSAKRCLFVCSNSFVCEFHRFASLAASEWNTAIGHASYRFCMFCCFRESVPRAELKLDSELGTELMEEDELLEEEEEEEKYTDELKEADEEDNVDNEEEEGDKRRDR